MKPRVSLSCLTALAAVATVDVSAQDWPQWRGANRDARAVEFKAPAAWPKELGQGWKVTVGEGVASPSVVGDRVFVFSRQDGSEVIRCLSLADGKELWQDKYESLGASGPAQGFSGPRSTPAVAEGKVLTLGVRGMVSVLEASSGKVLWRKDEFQAYPNFHPSSSPLIVKGLAIVQLGGRENGALVAYDLATGQAKWKWSGPSPSYASPTLLTVDGVQYVIAQTESKLVAVNASTGALAWEGEVSQGGGGPGGGGGRGMGGRDYRASSPVVDGAVLYYAGKGVKAYRFEKAGDALAARELWKNEEKSVQFNTPTFRGGRLYGLSANNELFCLDSKDGKTLWGAQFPGLPAAPGGGSGPGPRAAIESLRDEFRFTPRRVMGQAEPARPERPGGPGGPGGGRRGGGMGGGGAGYGNLVDAGPVMFSLTPAGQMLVFDPSGDTLKVLASYKVGDGQTHAYPVVVGQRILVKDRDSLTAWRLP